MAVKIGVIGAGVHGTHHVRLLSRHSDAELVGIYDADGMVAERTAGEFDTRAFHDIAGLCGEVDCVSVAVPTSLHRDVVLECLGHGVSVLVEKPISVTVAEADAMIETAEKNGLVLSVGHIERFNSAYRSILGFQPQPLFIESHRLAVFNPRGTDVAVVLDLMIHDIDIVLDMVKSPVRQVNASGVQVVTDEIDIANARLEFENGCVANITASRISQRVMRKVRAFQKNAYISMDFHSGESESFVLDPSVRPELEPGIVPQLMEGITYTRYTNDGGNALELELTDFLHAVDTGSPPQVTGRDGRAALAVAAEVLDRINNQFHHSS